MTTLLSANELDSKKPDDTAASGVVETRLLRMVRQEIRSVLEEALADTEYPLTPATTGIRIVDPAGSSAHIAPDREEARRPTDQDLGPEYRVTSPINDRESRPAGTSSQDGLGAALKWSLGDLALDLVEQEALEASGREPSEEELFEGTVRLTIEANGCNRQVLHFVEQLCQLPAVRLLQLVGNSRREGADVWIGLREPACLKMVLLQMPGVVDVATPVGCSPEGHERLLVVRLA